MRRMPSIHIADSPLQMTTWLWRVPSSFIDDLATVPSTRIRAHTAELVHYAALTIVCHMLVIQGGSTLAFAYIPLVIGRALLLLADLIQLTCQCGSFDPQSSDLCSFRLTPRILRIVDSLGCLLSCVIWGFAVATRAALGVAATNWVTIIFPMVISSFAQATVLTVFMTCYIMGRFWRDPPDSLALYRPRTRLHQLVQACSLRWFVLITNLCLLPLAAWADDPWGVAAGLPIFIACVYCLIAVPALLSLCVGVAGVYSYYHGLQGNPNHVSKLQISWIVILGSAVSGACGICATLQAHRNIDYYHGCMMDNVSRDMLTEDGNVPIPTLQMIPPRVVDDRIIAALSLGCIATACASVFLIAMWPLTQWRQVTALYFNVMTPTSFMRTLIAQELQRAQASNAAYAASAVALPGQFKPPPLLLIKTAYNQFRRPSDGEDLLPLLQETGCIDCFLDVADSLELRLVIHEGSHRYVRVKDVSMRLKPSPATLRSTPTPRRKGRSELRKVLEDMGCSQISQTNQEGKEGTASSCASTYHQISHSIHQSPRGEQGNTPSISILSSVNFVPISPISSPCHSTGQLCLVCFEQTPAKLFAVFMECGHTGCCLKCAERLLCSADVHQRKCPFCREFICYVSTAAPSSQATVYSHDKSPPCIIVCDTSRYTAKDIAACRKLMVTLNQSLGTRSLATNVAISAAAPRSAFTKNNF